MAASSHAARLQQLERTLDDYFTQGPCEEDEGADRGKNEQIRKKIARILSDVCNVVRDIGTADASDYMETLARTDGILSKGIQYAHSMVDEQPYVHSFAHSDASPVVHAAPEHYIETQIVWFHQNQGHGNMREFLKIVEPSLVRRHGVLSAAITPTQLNSTATFIYQARCEIAADSICAPIRATISPCGSCLAVNSGGGWRSRETMLSFHHLDGDGSEPLKLPFFNAGLDGVASYTTMHESRKLLFAADDKRIKSFAWASSNGLYGLLELRLAPDPRTYWKHIIGKHHDPCDDDYYEEESNIEPSGGTKATNTIKFSDPTLAPTVWHTHPSAAGSMVCGFEWMQPHNFSCIVVDLEHGGSTATRYLGHGGKVLEISTSSADPNTFVTGCSDGYARLFDVRQPLPAMIFNAGRESSDCPGVALAYPDAIPTLFTGSTKQQEVRLWDIRARTTVFELSTGNTGVVSLAWDDAHNALFAATECGYVNHIGNHGYRTAKEPKFMREERQRAEGDDMVVDDEDEEDYFSDDDDDDRGWPRKAFHGEEYFGYLYDAGDHMLIRYTFKEEPDIAILPEYGDATMDTQY
ncbi:hypothetical protein DXG01_001686 [Tephrocybe rancida]|nr:hypothetical protein DXG01_001686 [Tephrocybe rancida]